MDWGLWRECKLSLISVHSCLHNAAKMRLIRAMDQVQVLIIPEVNMQ